MFKPTPEQISDWVKSNFDCRSRKNGDELLIANPFYHNDKMKMNVSCSKGLVHDWRGEDWANGNSPTFLRFVQMYRKCSFSEAVKEVCGEGTSLKSIVSQIKREKNLKIAEAEEKRLQEKLILPEGSIRITDAPDSMLKKMVVNYLKSRGMDEDTTKQYDIHFQGDNAVWPYYEYEELVYYQSRNITNKIFDFPSKNVVSVGKEDFLYGFDMVEPSDYLITTESIIDAITLGEQCVATGGVRLSDMQVHKIRALNPVGGIILAPDNDKAGVGSIVHDYNLLSPYFNVLCSIPPKEYDGEECKDWNNLYQITGSKNKVREVFNENIKPVTPDLVLTF